MLQTVYSVLFSLLLPVIFFRLWVKGRSLPAYRLRWKERLGFVNARQGTRPCIWFHTVSVGEFIAAKPLIQHYLSQGHVDIYVTTMTPTGSDRVIATFGRSVFHAYSAYDVPILIENFLSRCKPCMHICMETELWPNTLTACRRQNIPVVLANGRLSEKSQKGYARFSSLSRRMLCNISAAAIQNDQDANRFIDLGLPEERIKVTGNIKFDLTIDTQLIDKAHELKSTILTNMRAPSNPHPTEALADERIFIAASTHRGEDEIVLEAFKLAKETFPRLFLILVPRHPERFDDVHGLCTSFGFHVARRSDALSLRGETKCDVLLGDTMGELLLLLGAADIAFIGGSFVDNGGHNYIEAAAWSLPILSGPSQYNFQVIADELTAAGALLTAQNTNELANHIVDLCNKDLALTAGRAGKAVADKNRGALRRLIDIVNITLKQ